MVRNGDRGRDPGGVIAGDRRPPAAGSRGVLGGRAVLDGLELGVPSEGQARDRRTQRRRQVDAALAGRRSRRARRGRDLGLRRELPQRTPCTLRPHAAARLPASLAERRSTTPASRSRTGASRAARRASAPRRSSRVSGLRVRSDCARSASPGGCASGSRSCARSSPTSRCCSSTSRSERSTRSPAVELQEWLAGVLDEEPRTVLLVTHDVEEALLLCERVVVLAGGGVALELEVDLPRRAIAARARHEPCVSSSCASGRSRRSDEALVAARCSCSPPPSGSGSSPSSPPLPPGYLFPAPTAVASSLARRPRAARSAPPRSRCGRSCSATCSRSRSALARRGRPPLLGRLCGGHCCRCSSSRRPCRPSLLAPILAILLGYGIEPKLVVVAVVCFFPIVVNAVDGFRATRPGARADDADARTEAGSRSSGGSSFPARCRRSSRARASPPPTRRSARSSASGPGPRPGSAS